MKPKIPHAAGRAAEPVERYAAYPPLSVAWVSVLIFFLATVLAIMDRGLLALVTDSVRHDLGITDVQIALLQGLAFAVFYTTVGVPVGALADRVSRRRLLIGGMIVWSAATVGCGLALDFGGMFLARLGVGFGEAVLGPCVVTMIGDLFAPGRRGAPMAVYSLGYMVATGVGSLLSAYILEAAPRGAFDAVPILAGLAPWRIAFVLVGGTGFAMALGVGSIREPPSRGVLLTGNTGFGFVRAARYLTAHHRAFLPFYGILATYALGVSNPGAWGAVLLIRQYGFDAAQAGKALGVAQIFAAFLGAAIASVMVDLVVHRYGTSSKIAFAAGLALLAWPSALAAGAPDRTLAVIMIAHATMVNAIFGTAMLSSITEMVPVDMRGICVALYAFVMLMIGATLGPLAVATLTQVTFHDPTSVGVSMALVGTVAFLATFTLAWVCYRAIGAEQRRSYRFAQVVRANLSEA